MLIEFESMCIWNWRERMKKQYECVIWLNYDMTTVDDLSLLGFYILFFYYSHICILSRPHISIYIMNIWVYDYGRAYIQFTFNVIFVGLINDAMSAKISFSYFNILIVHIWYGLDRVREWVFEISKTYSSWTYHSILDSMRQLPFQYEFWAHSPAIISDWFPSELGICFRTRNE